MKAFILLIIGAIWSFNTLGRSNSAIISGKFDFLKDGDSVILQIHKNKVFIEDIDMVKIVRKVIHGRFLFKVPLDGSVGYISLILPYTGDNSNGSKNIYDFLIERGDSILYSDKNKVEYSGRGSGKWGVQRKLAAINNRLHHKPLNSNGLSSISDELKVIDSLAFSKSKLIFHNRKSLSNRVFRLLLIDNASNARIIRTFILRNNKMPPADISNFLLSYHDPSIGGDLLIKNSSGILSLSNSFCEGLIAKYRFDICFRKNESFSVIKCYRFFRTNYSGPIREKLLTLLLYKYRNAPEDMIDCVNDAHVLVSLPNLRNILKSLKKTAIQSGGADNFTLPDTSNKMISLTSFRGRMMLIDFWFTGCTPCRMMAEKIKEIEPRLDRDSVVLVSINIDRSRERWIESIKSGQYTSPHAINLNTQFKGNEHPLIKHYLVTSFPTLLLFDKEGKQIRSPKNPLTDDGKDLFSLLDHY